MSAEKTASSLHHTTSRLRTVTSESWLTQNGWALTQTWVFTRDNRGGWTRSHDSPRDQILCMGIPYGTLFSQSSCLRPVKVISFESTCLVISENPLNLLQPRGTRGAMQPFSISTRTKQTLKLILYSDKQFLHEASAHTYSSQTSRLAAPANTKVVRLGTRLTRKKL